MAQTEPIEPDDLDYSMVDYYEETFEDTRRRLYALLDGAGITVDELREQGRTKEFTSDSAWAAWFWFHDRLDKYG